MKMSAQTTPQVTSGAHNYHPGHQVIDGNDDEVGAGAGLPFGGLGKLRRGDSREALGPVVGYAMHLLGEVLDGGQGAERRRFGRWPWHFEALSYDVNAGLSGEKDCPITKIGQE